jgi:hypothetical protein
MKSKLMLMLLMINVAASRVGAQDQEIEQLLLNVQKLAQLKQILADMKTGYEIVSKGYTAIRDISKGNFNLHQLFLKSLFEVSPVVKNFKKVADIGSYQIQIAREYKLAFTRFKESNLFSVDEINYIGNVYSSLFNQSLKNLDQLITIITASRLRMSDDERLSAIDDVDLEMQDKLSFLRAFNNRTSILGLQRARQQADVNAMKVIHGIIN